MESADSSNDEGIPIARKRMKISKRYCPHCKETLSYKTFRTHKRRFYDVSRSVWHEEVVEGLDFYPSCSPPPLSPLLSMNEITPTVHNDASPPSLHHHDIGQFSGPESESSSRSSLSSSSDTEESRIWSDDSEGDSMFSCNEEPPNLEPQVNPEVEKQIALSTWLTILILFLHMRYHLTEQITSKIFRVLKVFLCVLGRFCSFCVHLASAFPNTFYQALKRHNMKSEHFKRYIVCKKCHQVYHLNECIEGSGINRKSKSCLHRGLERRACDTVLLKTVEMSSGKKVFMPFLTYCYVDLKTSMQRLLNCSDFVHSCEHWRQHSSPDNTLKSVYNGKIWKDFLQYKNIPFLEEPHNYGLILNLDWFQPYKHLTYSVGVIYLSVLNLPSHIRYNESNTLLVGVLPGPHEPKGTINTYLEPLVNDLMEFWNGVPLYVQGIGEKRVRCALLCVSCDSPAGRKACGFLGHCANFGCTKCKKVFSGGVGQKNYSGFDRDNWVYRSNETHRTDALRLLHCKTKTDLKRNESASGCRYSVLLTLPYFDPTRMLAIDPMHTLFLCVAKHYLQNVWIKNNLISAVQFSEIQTRVDNIKVPAGIGRIPTKIQSGFAAFTADQFKNWVLYYSLLGLRGILINADMECWKHFVLACRILCSKHISKERLQLADLLLLKFCQRTERQYGEGTISPSMHMICHLKECVLDYGPLHEFWLFPFERFNGSLGQLPNNNKCIEIQLIKRFMNDQQVSTITQPQHFREDFSALLTDTSKPVGSLGDSLHSSCTWEAFTSSNRIEWSMDSIKNSIVLPSHYRRSIFDAAEVPKLAELYSILYSVNRSDIDVTSSFHKYKSCYICSKVVGAFRSRSAASSHIMVRWESKYFGPSPGNSTSDPNQEIRPARINYFAKDTVNIKGEMYTHILVSISWFKHHPLENLCGKPVSIWECDLFEMPGVHSIIPIQFICSRAITLLDKIHEHDPTSLFVIPCVDF